ncbi:hypothetical protein FGO68_gene17494 [Halteria grandinella]|uniref:Uncharacterized protein n=1 Tax=Halteria grandinella TaxID=5974 RepID=A0A8J8P0K6_HALGN|nr:hypothetical protein FGO68_gene17494 [Halteria grandinella]
MLDQRTKKNHEGLEKHLFRGQDFDSIIQTIGILDDSELRRAVQNLKPEQKDWKALGWLIQSKGQQPQGSLTTLQAIKIKALSSRLAAFQYGLKQYELESNSLIDQINYCAQGGAQQHYIQVEVDLARLEYAFNKQIIKEVWEKYSEKLPKNQYEIHIAFDIDNFQQKYKMQFVKINSNTYRYQIKQKVEGYGKYPGDKTKCHYQLYARVEFKQNREFILCRLCEGSSLDIFGCAKLE